MQYAEEERYLWRWLVHWSPKNLLMQDPPEADRSAKSCISGPSTKTDQEKCFQWAQKCWSSDRFIHRWMLCCTDGPDEWSSGWLVKGRPVQTRLWHHQRSSGWWFVLLQYSEVRWKVYLVSEGVKMISARYVEFITDHFLLWCDKNNNAFRKTMIFTKVDVPSNAAKINK